MFGDLELDRARKWAKKRSGYLQSTPSQHIQMEREMRLLVGAICLSVGLSLTLPQPGAAQERPQVREGFFIGFGLGWGSLGCSDCGGEREGGFSGYLKLGGTVNDQLLLGFETNGWTKEENGVTLSQGNLSGTAYYYPQPEKGFFLKGGLGLSTLDLSISGFGEGSETGFGLIGGLGWDARVGSNFSLTPYANFVYGSFDGGSTNVVQAGLGLTWH